MAYNKSSIELLFKELGCHGKHIVKKFPSKEWKGGTVKRLIQKIIQTRSLGGKKSSGHPLSAKINEYIDKLNKQILSPEDNPGMNTSERQILPHTKISQASVQYTDKNHLKLNAYKMV